MTSSGIISVGTSDVFPLTKFTVSATLNTETITSDPFEIEIFNLLWSNILTLYEAQKDSVLIIDAQATSLAAYLVIDKSTYALNDTINNSSIRVDPNGSFAAETSSAMKLAYFTVSVEVFNQQDASSKRVVSPVFSFMVFDCLP